MAEPTAIDRIRMARGLLLHYERDETYRRGCIPGLSSYYRREHKPNGRCLWCRQPVKRKRASWHTHCATAYQLAKGSTSAFGLPLISRYTDGTQIKHWPEEADLVKCEICEKRGTELDHRVALSIAHHMGRRAELRAYQIDNLRWLCHECHLVKTAADRRALASLKRGDAPQEALAF